MKINKHLIVLLLLVIFASLLGTNRIPVAKADITSGLLTHWKFDETSGTTAADSSGNGYSGTLNNGPAFTTARLNNGLNFDGINDEVSASDRSATDGLSSMTVSAWVYLDANSTQDNIAYEVHNAAPWFSWQLVAYDVNFQFELNDAAGGHAVAWTSYDPYPSTWYHVVAVYQSGSPLKIYLNGSDYTGGSTGAVSGPLLDTNMGLNVSSNSAAAFDGLIDDVRVYNRALNASDVWELYSYTETPTPPPPPPPAPQPPPPPPPPGANNYYVDSVSGSDSNAGTSTSAPWRTLTKVNSTTFSPGDIINFKRGGVWTGTLTISNSGTSGNPITFQDYGSGNVPLIQRASSPESSGFTRTVVINGSWIVFQNFLITNAHEAGIFLNTSADRNIIRNNEITATGYGVAVYGQSNLLTQNYAHDLHMIVSDAGGANYGAGCFFIQQSGTGGNEISYNRAINCRVPDPFFDINGKFVEVFNNGDNLYVHHNYAENAGGFFEAGANGSGSAANIRFVYNVLVNSHASAAQPTTSVCFNTGSYNITLSNFVFDNNTVYQQTGDGGVWRIFGCNSNLSFMTVRNNVFYSDSQVANNVSFTHTNNLYHMTNGAGVGYALGSGESTGNPLFVNAGARDFHLQSTSPAINTGLNLGYTTDNGGAAVPVGSAPDKGAFEYGSVSVQPITGDINLDHIVNSVDYSILNSDWFTANTRSDLNYDGLVNSVDFSVLNSNWFKTW